MEQKTPAHGSSFWRIRSGVELGIRAKAQPPDADLVQQARELAARAAAIIPPTFDRVLPRGYTVNGSFLVMARFEMVGSRGNALYGKHTHWGEKETSVFLKDLEEGWLTELSSYMRWQLRNDPIANATFQHALVHLHHEAMQQLQTV